MNQLNIFSESQIKTALNVTDKLNYLARIEQFCEWLGTLKFKASMEPQGMTRDELADKKYVDLRRNIVFWQPGRGWTRKKNWRESLSAKRKSLKEKSPPSMPMHSLNGVKLCPGAQVHWTSQAGGCAKKKQGVIVALVPSQSEMMPFIPEEDRKVRSRIKGQNVSLIDRVLIAVKRKTGIIDYYSPRPSQVEVVRKSKSARG